MKQQIREEILQKRKNLSKEEVNIKSKPIKENFYSLGCFKKAKNILFYVSYGNEADTQNIIGELLEKKDKKILIPYIMEDNPILQVSEIKDFNDLEPKAFGILETKENKINNFNPDDIDLIIIPGIAFDRNGHRIGHGNGYYDKFLSSLKRNPVKIALAFDFQIVDKIDNEEHDVPIDIIITEKEIIHCK